MSTRPLGADETPSDIARKGYDQSAQAYLDWTTSLDSPRMKWLEKLFSYLQNYHYGSVPRSLQGLKILDLGCGAGVPTTSHIANTTGRVVGLDISQEQISLAQKFFRDAGIRVDGDNVQLRAEDILEAKFEVDSFDAICAFYSIIHLSVEDQEILFEEVLPVAQVWGYLLFNMLTNPSTEGREITDSWLGMKAYWASPGAEGTQSMLKKLRYDLSEMAAEKTEGDADFTWFIARYFNPDHGLHD